MEHHFNMQRRGVLLIALLAISARALAFTRPAPIRIARIQRSVPVAILPPKVSPVSPNGHLYLFNNDNKHDSADLDWKSALEEAGDFASNVGGKAWKLVKKGGSKLIDLAVKGAKSITGKTALRPSKNGASQTKGESPLADSKDDSFPRSNRAPIVDTQDEALFRSICKDEDYLPDPFVVSDTVDPVVDQAAILIQQDKMAASAFGGSVQHSYPIAQSIQSKSQNGKMTTNVETSFEVWGLQGRGLASVTSVDGKISSLELQINGQNYPIRPTPTSGVIPKVSLKLEVPRAWEPEEVGTLLEVEVLEGVRRLVPPKGSQIIDAEILDKKIM